MSSKILTVSSKILPKVMSRHNIVFYVDTDSVPLHFLIIFIVKILKHFYIELLVRCAYIK